MTCWAGVLGGEKPGEASATLERAEIKDQRSIIRDQRSEIKDQRSKRKKCIKLQKHSNYIYIQGRECIVNLPPMEYREYMWYSPAYQTWIYSNPAPSPPRPRSSGICYRRSGLRIPGRTRESRTTGPENAQLLIPHHANFTRFGFNSLV